MIKTSSAGFLNKPFVRKPYTINGDPIWQGCYVCGMAITFNRFKDMGTWINIGDGLIRHKKCLPEPAR